MSATIHQGDAPAVLRTLPSGSVELSRRRIAAEAAQANTPETVPAGAEAQLGLRL